MALPQLPGANGAVEHAKCQTLHCVQQWRNAACGGGAKSTRCETDSYLALT